ncbi:type II toxin-antitoxin system HicA family toxin [Candidatus Parcubacteria bacterium]|nr:type II toxin-antitoxin system HicA family toxin [Candidatus Parcubacteria bacterium]
MPSPISFRLILKILKKRGFFFVSQTGSHAKYRKLGNPTINVIVPIHEKEVRYGTFRSILRQSKLKENDFKKRKN